MRVKLDLNFSRRSLAIILVAVMLGVVVFVLYLMQGSANPLPSDINRQINYKVIFPANTSQIDASSYAYKPDQKSLSFNVQTPNSTVVFVEQPVPDSIDTSQSTVQALGLHPYAQFQSKFGQVALAKFFEHESLAPVGESGILATNGTLLIAHSEKNMTNAEWKSLFASLKITQ